LDSSDLDAAPPITQADFDRARFRVADRDVSRAEWQAAAQAQIGQCAVSLDLDAPIVAHFKALAGQGDYRKLINDTLRRVIEGQYREADLRAIIRDELKHRFDPDAG
jgi:uncharacterized protein (DUF4415 family)